MIWALMLTNHTAVIKWFVVGLTRGRRPVIDACSITVHPGLWGFTGIVAPIDMYINSPVIISVPHNHRDSFSLLLFCLWICKYVHIALLSFQYLSFMLKDSSPFLWKFVFKFHPLSLDYKNFKDIVVFCSWHTLCGTTLRLQPTRSLFVVYVPFLKKVWVASPRFLNSRRKWLYCKSIDCLMCQSTLNSCQIINLESSSYIHCHR